MRKVFDGLNGSRATRNYVEAALTAGVTGIHVTVNNFTTIRPYPSLREALQELACIRAHYAAMADVVRFVETSEDLSAAQAQGKLAVLLGFQNVPGIDRDLALLEIFRALGVRVIQIAHNKRGLYADGCAEEADAGLSGLGRELVHALNELGILIDLSHTGDRSTIEAAELSEHPVAATHANANAVCPNVRNKNDEALNAIRRGGGVVGLCYLPPLVGSEAGEAGHAAMARHACHIKERIGADCIGIGSDFIEGQPAERYQEFLRHPDVYGTWPWVFPVRDLQDQQLFLEELKSVGFTDDEIDAVAGGNFERVLRSILN